MAFGHNKHEDSHQVYFERHLAQSMAAAGTAGQAVVSHEAMVDEGGVAYLEQAVTGGDIVIETHERAVQGDTIGIWPIRPQHERNGDINWD